MTTWTDTAKQELETYFDRVRPGLDASGADAAEVIEDIRRHIEQEAAAAQLAVVTGPDVQRLLARIGAPDSGRDSGSRPQQEPAPPFQQPPAVKQVQPPVWALLLGVVLPTITLFIEWLTGVCAGAFFDPLPSFWHVLMVGAVPLANGLTWWSLSREPAWRRCFLGWANGFALGISVYYAILFLPLLLPGLFAVVFFGWGLLPWTPMLALIATLALRQRLKFVAAAPGSPLPGLWRGLALAWLALAVVDAPVWITRSAMQMALSEEAPSRQRALHLLRRVGNHEVILRECYGRTPAAAEMDIVGWIIGARERVPPEKARELYYRVTGRPFNSVPAPRVRTGRGRWAGLDDWSWDSDQGRDRVGARVNGLYLESSRLDAVVEPDAATAYTEWTLVFKNNGRRQAEARAQIILPPGGVVSRLTLWVNGEEREAAFGTRSQVRTAYERVAIRQRRDPVLVTTCGPDRILVQCFPVPPDGNTMKVRLGITAPLSLVDGAEGLLVLPCFAERNFTLTDSLRHAVWIESSAELTDQSGGLRSEQPKSSVHALRGSLPDIDLTRQQIRVRRNPACAEVWTKDTLGGPEAIVRQKLAEVETASPQKVVVVLDGSVGMERTYPAVADFLRNLNAAAEPEVLVAGDTVFVLRSTSSQPNSASPAQLAGQILALRTAGGQDNLPALEQAWDIAAGRTNSVVLWICGPQPVLLNTPELLRQRYQRRPSGPTLLTLQIEAGPNRILEQLSDVAQIRAVPLIGSPSDSLDRLAGSWKPGARKLVPQRTRQLQGNTEPPSGASPASPHIARLWAFEEVERLIARRSTSEAAALAARYQLVTSVTGAVVLETREQYVANNLEPVDPATVPSIPEPATYVLLGLGLVVLVAARRIRR